MVDRAEPATPGACLPRIMKVALLSDQHSRMFGQWDESHTVCNEYLLVISLTLSKSPPTAAVVLNQSGFSRGSKNSLTGHHIVARGFY